ncbi:MAG: hypothetical protein ACI8X5_000605 [Planctomycetota bacterium]|jgi:hypothetical protein
MSAIQGNSGSQVRSFGTSVLKMQMNDAKLQGEAAMKLLEGAAVIQTNRPKGGNASGIGMHVDVHG